MPKARGPHSRPQGTSASRRLEATLAGSGEVTATASQAFQRVKGGWGPGLALVLATVLVSGISNFVNFRAVQGTNADAWISVRNTAVAGMLVPLALLLRPPARPRLGRGDWARLIVIGLMGGAIPFLLYFHGFQLAAVEGGAASASLGFRSLFLLATVLALLFLRERVSRGFVAAAGLLFAGNVLLLGLSGPVWTDGTPYVLLATALWAGEYTMSKRTLRTLPPATVALGRMGFGAVFLVGYLGLTGQIAAVGLFAPADWMNLAFSALLLFAFVATWYAGLKTVDLSVASSILVLASPITWILSIAAAGTAATPEGVAGTLAVGAGAMLAVWVATLRGQRRPHARGSPTERDRTG